MTPDKLAVGRQMYDSKERHRCHHRGQPLDPLSPPQPGQSTSDAPLGEVLTVEGGTNTADPVALTLPFDDCRRIIPKSSKARSPQGRATTVQVVEQDSEMPSGRGYSRAGTRCNGGVRRSATMLVCQRGPLSLPVRSQLNRVRTVPVRLAMIWSMRRAVGPPYETDGAVTCQQEFGRSRGRSSHQRRPVCHNVERRSDDPSCGAGRDRALRRHRSGARTRADHTENR